MANSKEVLFLCSGNYYRSRFAEIYFNHLAGERGLSWHATSAGLVVDRPNNNVGPISKDAVERLARNGLSVADDIRNRMPIQLEEAELARADRVIALKEAEHRPLMGERFPDWTDRITYWHIHDLDVATADEALSNLAEQVRSLVEQLKEEQS